MPPNSSNYCVIFTAFRLAKDGGGDKYKGEDWCDLKLESDK